MKDEQQQEWQEIDILLPSASTPAAVTTAAATHSSTTTKKRGNNNVSTTETRTPPISTMMDNRYLYRAAPTTSSPRHSCNNTQRLLTIPSLILNGVLLIVICTIIRTTNVVLDPGSRVGATSTSSWKPPSASAAAAAHTSNTTTTTTRTITWRSKNNTTMTTGYYVPYDKIIGHLHYAKTAGTEINGELAAHYERVCGHKGYSYDAVQFNKRVKMMQDSTGKTDLNMVGGKDVIAATYKGYNRGRVIPTVMVEIGYEDCDYISLEESWEKWNEIVGARLAGWPLELHVPCREPLNHLLSQCNHRGIECECDIDDEQELYTQVDECLLMPERFDLVGLAKVPNLTLKCFNPLPIEPYLEYMDQILQRKRIETQYIHRTSNVSPRNKALECIWKNKGLADRVLKILETYDYYSWCLKCLGSDDDLLGLPW